VRITTDTDLLLRVILEDVAGQAADAKAVLDQASLVAIPTPVFCELVWTMRRLYRRASNEIAEAIEAILRVHGVVTDRLAVETGLSVLRAGGDFADGTIAWQGAAMGGETFLTFDRAAVRVLSANGLTAAVPGGTQRDTDANSREAGDR
jgi:predicted nucleic-acid-binding protein